MKEGGKTYKYFCPSIDSVGHTAEKASEALKNVLERTLGSDVEVFCATADSGGGGSIDNTYPLLQILKVMAMDSKETNCAIHGLHKALGNPSKLTMGDQGLGTRSPFQMLWVFVKMMSEIRERGGIQLIDQLWEAANRELIENDEWKQHTKEKFQRKWNDFVEKVETLEAADEKEATEKLDEFLMNSPRNVQDPVWTRWASESLCALLAIHSFVTNIFCF